jgi:hypothetical protein
MASINSFRNTHSIEERKRISGQILAKYKDKACIIIEKSKLCKDKSITIKRTKYLADKSITIGELVNRVKKEIENIRDQAIFILIVDKNMRGISPTMSSNINEMYTKYHHDDGFMYMEFLCENTFGIK